MVSDIDSISLIKIFYVLFKYYAEEDSKERWCQDSTLLHPIVDLEGLWEVTVLSDLAMLVFVQLDDHFQELWTDTSSNITRKMNFQFRKQENVTHSLICWAWRI